MGALITRAARLATRPRRGAPGINRRGRGEGGEAESIKGGGRWGPLSKR